MSTLPFIASPKKRTSKKARSPVEFEGRVARVTFHNPENGFSVLQVAPKDGRGLETVVGFALPVSAGLYVQAKGRWQSCESGHQLRAEIIRTELPTDPAVIEKCLGSGLVEAIGPTYAKRFMEAFGGKIFTVIEKHPEKLLTVEGVGQKRCDLIVRSWAEQKVERFAVNYLVDHGVSSELAVKIYKKYGHETVRIVKENPYQLVKSFRGVDFHWADTLAKSIGYGVHSSVRARAGIDYVLNDVSVALGNCCMLRGEIVSMAAKFLDVPKRVIEKAIDAEIESGILVASDIPEPDSIYPAELYRAEEGIVTEIRRLASKSLPWRLVDVDAAVSEEEEKRGLHLTHTQKDAVGAALTSKVSVIAGGPGMGKTTTLKTFLSILENEGAKIQLCAPSESGARRFSELTHREVKRIRKLLEYNVAEGVFNRSRENPVECDLLVVGDSTVLDIRTAHRLLAALPSNAAVLFVGDKDLLPSVGPGMFFSDLIDSQVVPVVQFNEVIHEGSASWIAKVAHQIKSGETPVFPNKVDDGNCYFMRVDDAAEIPEALKELVVKRLPQAYRLQKTRDLQVLCPMSQGGAGTEAFNALLRHDLAGHWGEFGRFGRRYEKKDKVMQAADNVLRGTCVGEVGYVTDFDLQARELYVNFDGRVVCYPFDDLDELIPGYALTVDKARGYEFPGVIIPLSTEHTIMLRRDVLYTAVTRGQKLVVLVGEPEALETAVKRTDDRKRRTGLVERLMRGIREFD